MKKQQEPRPQTGSPWIPRMEDPERGRGHSARVKETGDMDGDPSTCWLLLLPGALAQSPEQEMELGTTRASNIHPKINGRNVQEFMEGGVDALTRKYK